MFENRTIKFPTPKYFSISSKSKNMKLLTFVGFLPLILGNYFIWDRNVRFSDMERWNKEVTKPCLESRVTFKSDEVDEIRLEFFSRLLLKFAARF